MKIFLVSSLVFLSFIGKAQLDTTGAYLNNFQYTVFWSQEAVVNGDTIVRLKCNLNVPDTSSIAAVKVKVGAFKGDGSLVNYTFPFVNSSVFPNDYSIAISGNSIQLDLGNQPPGRYFFSVVIHDSYGRKSSPLFYDPFTNQLSDL